MKHTPADNSSTTSRDAIDSWLDVLVSMLSLPASNKDQVRDELEDHLRSRVDDLLVMGTPEREAIQTAINELGETAELAKLISSATRTRTPFRRFAMNAVFFVLAGSVLTASVSMMMPSSSLPATEREFVSEVVQRTTPDRHSFDISDASTYDLLREVATEFGLEFTMSKDSREYLLEQGMFGLTKTFKGNYDLAGATEAILQQYMFHLMGIEVVHDEDSLRLMTSEEYARSQVEIRAYPIPSWAKSDDEQVRFALSIERLLNTKHDLVYTTIQAINNSLVVAAPPAVHQEILDMAAQLKALGEEVRNEERKRLQREQLVLEEKLQHLRVEYQSIKNEYFKQREFTQTMSMRQEIIFDDLHDLRRSAANDASLDSDVKAMEHEVRTLTEVLAQQKITMNEAEKRFERVQHLLLDVEQEQLKVQLSQTGS